MLLLRSLRPKNSLGWVWFHMHEWFLLLCRCFLVLSLYGLVLLSFHDFRSINLRSDFDCATLASWADCNTFAVVGSVFLAEDVFENWKFVIVNIKEVVDIILFVIKVYNSKIIWTLLCSICFLRTTWFLFFSFIWYLCYFRIFCVYIEPLNDLVFKSVVNWVILKLRLINYDCLRFVVINFLTMRYPKSL